MPDMKSSTDQIEAKLKKRKSKKGNQKKKIRTKWFPSTLQLSFSLSQMKKA